MRLGFNASFIVPMRDKPEDLIGEIPWIRIEDFEGRYINGSKSGQGVSYGTIREMSLKVFPVGTVLCSCSCSMGATAIVGKPLISNQTFIGIVPRDKLVSEYVYYLMQVAKEHLTALATGAIQQYLSRNDFSSLRMPLLPKGEQRAIATFLDRETAKTDALVAKNERLIELLQEKRTALITRAVTKGLDTGVPMKDSGVEWLGEIPAHWEVIRIGRKIMLQRGVDITKEQQNEGAVPVVSSGGASSFHDRALARGPGVVIGRKGTAGAVYYIEVDYWPHDTVLWVKDFRGSHPRFVFYKLSTMDLGSFDTGSANPTLNRNLVHPVIVSWPPLPEQSSIADYLDRETAKMDRLTARIETAIDHLMEFRTALISAAVTGKIDVRDEIPQVDIDRPHAG